MPKLALFAHDFVPSGIVKQYLSGERLEACSKCNWPHDEHPDHPSRKPNWKVYVLPDGKEGYWAGSRKDFEKMRIGALHKKD